MKKRISAIFTFLFAIFFPFIFGFVAAFFPKNIINSIPEIFFYLIPQLLLILFLYLIYKDKLKEEWQLFKSNWKIYLEKNLYYWIMGLILMGLLNSIIGDIVVKDMPENEQLVRMMLKDMPIYMLFSTLISAPFTEEIIYRKTLNDIFNNEKMYVVFSGILFGLAHVIYSYTKILDFLYIIPYGVLGGAFAIMYYKTKNIFVPITFHFTHNFLSVMIILVFSLL